MRHRAAMICELDARARFVALALMGLACGPPQFPGGLDAGETNAEDASSSSEESSTTSSSSSTTSATSTTSSSDETDDETSSTSLPGFIPEDEDMYPAAECDPFAQDCPDGEKCVPYGSTGGNWDANKCVPVLGDQAPGEPCMYGGVVEATDDCDATSHCWDVMDVDGEAIGTCTAFCTGTADTPECPEGTWAFYLGDVMCLCIETCDPIEQDCGEGLACFWANNGFNCIFTTQDIPAGEPCGFINDCAAGLGCLTAEVLPSCAGSACCSAWCQLGAGDQQCEVLPGTTCVSFFEEGMAPPGYEHVGVCIVPPP
jgi:hypothetical protein